MLFEMRVLPSLCVVCILCVLSGMSCILYVLHGMSCVVWDVCVLCLLPGMSVIPVTALSWRSLLSGCSLGYVYDDSHLLSGAEIDPCMLNTREFVSN